MGMLDNTVRKLNDVLDSCAKSVASRAKARPRKAKLKVKTPDVRKALEANLKCSMNGRRLEGPRIKSKP